MKAHREHRVPLSPLARSPSCKACKKLARETIALSFPGPRLGKSAFQRSIVEAVWSEWGSIDLTVHGFRATFKTWASERTSVQNEIVEAALRPRHGGKVEQAYSARRHVREAAAAGICSSGRRSAPRRRRRETSPRYVGKSSRGRSRLSIIFHWRGRGCAARRRTKRPSGMRCFCAQR